MSIAKYLRDKNRFTEQDITRIQNFIHMAFQHKSNKDANQGVEAIMNLNYPNDAALEATINWFAEGAPGSVSERETIEQQYKKFQEKKDTDKGVKDAFNGLRRYIATAKGEKDYDEKIRIIAEKAQKYLYEAVGTDRDIRFKDLFGEKSEIPNHIHPAYALEEYFSLIKRFDTRTNIGEYSQKLRDLLK